MIGFFRIDDILTSYHFGNVLKLTLGVFLSAPNFFIRNCKHIAQSGLNFRLPFYSGGIVSGTLCGDVIAMTVSNLSSTYAFKFKFVLVFLQNNVQCN